MPSWRPRWTTLLSYLASIHPHLSQVAVLATLRRFTFLPGTSTQLPLVADPKSGLNYPKGGLWVTVEERREV